MIVALKYLTEIADQFFERRMQHAARRISAGLQLFPNIRPSNG